MDIVICTDNNYVMPASVLICSICENNKKNNIVFHVIFNKELHEKNKLSLKEIVDDYKKDIKFYCINENINSLLPVGQKGQIRHITITSYYRLFLTSLLPTNINKVLYLDCDTIVRHNLDELWNTDINDYAVACVADQNEGSLSSYNRLRYQQQLGYFNAGVLLINLLYWREKNLQEIFINYIKENQEKLQCHDQDVLNYVLRNSKKSLPLKYNLQNGFLSKEINISWEYEDELTEAIKDPYIIHYIDYLKPWVKGCECPFKSEFFKYQRLTKWKNYPLQKSKIKPTIKQIVKRMLVFFKIVSKEKLYNYRDDITPLN